MREKGRLFYLLICLLLILIIYPFFVGATGTGNLAGKLFAVFFTGVLITGVYASSGRTRIKLAISFSLAVPALIFLWTDQFKASYLVDVLAVAFISLFCFFTVFCLLAHIMKARRVSANILAGAASAYLLLGISWSMLYMLLEIIKPGSFFSAETLQWETIASWSTFIYYSFTTLTTLGYGDMTPVTAYAQSLSILEAATGVLFVALLISRLVGMYLFQLREGNNQG